MARVKGGIMAQKRRRNILAEAKGYRFGRSKKKREAREAIYHAQLHAFDHRKDKKGDFRRLWTVRINAALMQHGIKYSRFIKLLKDQNIELNRKVLAQLAVENPEAFNRLVTTVSQ
jgi:large subunit ribosomal protein L20